MRTYLSHHVRNNRNNGKAITAMSNDFLSISEIFTKSAITKSQKLKRLHI